MTAKSMNWMTAALWVGVIASALAVVRASHDCRALFAELGQLEKHSDQLQVEWGQLLLEQATLASFGSVEQVARDSLNMRAPASDDIVVVRP